MPFPRCRAAAAAALLTTLALAAPARADVAPVSDFEVTSLAADRGISQAEARERLEDQRKLSALIDNAKKELASRYAGVHVEPDNGDRIVLRVKSDRPAPPASASEAADRAIEKARLKGKVSLRTTTRSEQEMMALQARIDRDLVAVNEGAPATVDVEPGGRSNQLQLTIPPSPTAPQREFINSARDRYGDDLRFGDKPGAATDDSCSSGAWCDPPLRGGVRIIYNGSGLCTAGPVVRSVSDNKLYLATAGHCLSGRYGTWSTHFASGSSHDIGVPHNLTNDLGILRINNVGGWGLPRAWIRIQSDNSYGVRGYYWSTVGQRVCMTGSFTGSNCREVTGGLATRDGKQYTLRANYCSTTGDSGSPTFSDHIVYGVHAGGYGDCDKVYTSAAHFSALLNVVPLTTSDY